MVKINVAINANRVRQWHADFALALIRAGHSVAWDISPCPAPPVPASLELLLSTERLIRGETPCFSAKGISPGELPPGQCRQTAASTINLDPTRSLAEPESGFRLIYDGIADEVAAFSALLSGRSPVIEVERVPENTVVARAVPSLEGCKTINGAYARVVWVASGLLIRAVDGNTPAVDAMTHSSQPLRMIRVPMDLLRGLATGSLRRLYSLCCYPSHWRVGWRFVTDADVWDRFDLAGPRWQNLVNPAGRYLADPFPFARQGGSYIFAEDFDQRTGKGVISFVAMDRNGPTGPPQPVLEEPWHLSYPFLLEHKGDVWMVPECSGSRQVLIYRAAPFPTHWVKEAVLLDDVFATDATILHHAGRFWMFVTASREHGYSDALEIYYADEILGPWVPHRSNPVLIDVRAARSAGNIVFRKGQLWRPVQDCRGGYGSALGLARIDQLTEDRYRQTVQVVLHPGPEWPGRRIHTLNRAGNIECIDGSSTTFRFA
jgi:hypothetical protein